MAPSFSSLRSSSRRRERPAERHELDDKYGDTFISPPNKGATWGEWSSPAVSPKAEEQLPPSQHTPLQDPPRLPSALPEKHALSITITIPLPWRSKNRSSSVPPLYDRMPEQVVPAPLEPISAVESRPPSRSRMTPPSSLSSRFSPPLPQVATRRSPDPQTASRQHAKPTPSNTPALGVLSPVVEDFDDRSATDSSVVTPIEISPSSPVKVSILDRHHEERDIVQPCVPPMKGSRSPGPERLRKSPPLQEPSRRAHSVDQVMHRRRTSASIPREPAVRQTYEPESEDEDIPVPGRGGVGYRPRTSTNTSSTSGNGLYDVVAKDYRVSLPWFISKKVYLANLYGSEYPYYLLSG